MVVARFRSYRGQEEVSEDGHYLMCTCEEGRATGGCTHIRTVYRYRRWRIRIDADSVLPPPMIRH